MRFVFGYDARSNLIGRANDAPDDLYHELVCRAELAIASCPRTRPRKVKDDVVRDSGLQGAAADQQRGLRAHLPARPLQNGLPDGGLTQEPLRRAGENVPFEEYCYFFYITNDRDLSADEVIREARGRCN